MTFTHWLLIAIVAVPLLLALLNRLRVDLAALLMALALGAAQLLGLGMLGPAGTPGDAVKTISGFSQPVVITLISLFILTRGLEKSGLTNWLARHIVRIAGKREGRLIGLCPEGGKPQFQRRELGRVAARRRIVEHVALYGGAGSQPGKGQRRAQEPQVSLRAAQARRVSLYPYHSRLLSLHSGSQAGPVNAAHRHVWYGLCRA